MTRLRALQSSLLLGTFIGIGSVSPIAQVSAPDTKPHVVISAHAAAFEQVLAVPPRITESGSALKALEEMGLSKNGTRAFTWASVSGGAGNYVFKDLRGVDSDGIPFTFETLSLSGLRMDGDDPVFDRIDMAGFEARDDDYSMSFKQWSMSRLPAPLSTAFARTFHDFGADDVLEAQFEDKDLGVPGALFMEDLVLDMKDDEMDGTLSLSVLGWGENKGTRKGQFALSGVNFELTDEEMGGPMSMSLGSMTARGLDMDVFRDVLGEIDFDTIDEDTADDITLLMYRDPYKKIYDGYAIDNFSLNYDALVLGLEHLGSNVTQVGDILTYKTVMKPLSLSFSGETQDPEIAEVRELMSEAGFEDFSLTAGSTTTLNKTYDRFQIENAYYELQDNARLRFDLAGKGLKSMMEAINAADDRDELSDDEAFAIFENATLDYLDMSMTDMSLVNKIFAIVARDAGVTPDLMKTKAKASLMMGAMMAQNPAQMAFAAQSSKAMTKLIDEGGTLEIKIRPDTPLTYESFADFDPSTFDPADYGLTISHRK